jgi:FkbM family methyltransferase
VLRTPPVTTRRYAPAVLEEALRTWVYPPERSFTADWRSAHRMRALRRRILSRPRPVRMRDLGDRPVYLRPRTADYWAARATFADQYHMPPEELAPKLIWDLGANIGLTAAHFAHRFPDARIVAVELDGRNAELARRNVAPWQSRCEVIHGAVWVGGSRIAYRRDRGDEEGCRVGPILEEAVEPNDEAPVVTLEALLSSHGAPDFVKMDIEGAEAAILPQAGEWARSACCIAVEIHPPYSVAECERDLRALGFEATRDLRHPALVVGRRAAR